MAQLVDLYNAKKSELKLDTIGKNTGNALKTPYSTDDLQKIDSAVVTEEFLKKGRGGVLNSKKYSDTVKK